MKYIFDLEFKKSYIFDICLKLKTHVTLSKDNFSLYRLDLHLVCQLQKQQNFLALVVFQNQLQVVQVSKDFL